MTRAENTTSSTEPQQDAVTRTMGFAETPISNEGLAYLFETRKGMDTKDSLQLAAHLTSGLKQLCEVMADAVNYDHIVLVDEMRVLAFVAEAANALIVASKPCAEGGAA